ncbi:MAG: DUF4258 domain-containing protein [Armatimonadota bacterium]|nr:DUF4258 domain-containing protein [Armatimonadota bacterium]
MDIYTICDLVRAQQIKFTKHASEERRHAQLSEAEVGESILSGDMLESQSDERGTKYRIRGDTFYTARTVESIVSVNVDEETEREFVTIITVFERKPRRKGGRRP